MIYTNFNLLYEPPEIWIRDKWLVKATTPQDQKGWIISPMIPIQGGVAVTF